MLHEFLDANRTELIERCRARVARRPAPRPTSRELEHGIPLFLGQLIGILRLEQSPDASEGTISVMPFGPAGIEATAAIRATAAKHGRELLAQGFTVDQVVHDYGDLCQSVIELAVEKSESIPREALGTLTLCLDHAIADAVGGFGHERDRLLGNRELDERLESLSRGLRGFLNTATLSFAAIKEGGVGVRGATAAVLEKSLAGMSDLVDHTLADVRLAAGAPSRVDPVDVERFIVEARVAGGLEARSRGCEFTVSAEEPGLFVQADRQLLHSAAFTLLHNAFRFTRPQGHVWLKAYHCEGRVLIEVEDECGGFPPGKAETLLAPLARAAPGGGLSIARRAVEAMGGSLRVRELPGVGCVFTIDLPVYVRSRTDTPLPGP